MGAGSTVRSVLQSSGRESAGQPGAGIAGRMASRWRPARACSARAVNGAVAARCSSRRRPVRAWRAGIDSSRGRSRLGSQRRASVPLRATVCIHAVRSAASATMAHQISFWAKSCSGRLASPVSFAQRIRSSARARRRCRNSRSASCPAGVGDECGDPVPVEVGDRQLRAGVRTFAADDQPHPGRPAGEVECPGHLGDPGTGADLAVGVVGRLPHVLGDARQLGLDRCQVPGQSEPDRVGQPAAGQPGPHRRVCVGGVVVGHHRHALAPRTQPPSGRRGRWLLVLRDSPRRSGGWWPVRCAGSRWDVLLRERAARRSDGKGRPVHRTAQTCARRPRRRPRGHDHRRGQPLGQGGRPA